MTPAAKIKRLKRQLGLMMQRIAYLKGEVRRLKGEPEPQELTMSQFASRADFEAALKKGQTKNDK